MSHWRGQTEDHKELEESKVSVCVIRQTFQSRSGLYLQWRCQAEQDTEQITLAAISQAIESREPYVFIIGTTL